VFRNFTDITNDAILRARQDEKHVGLLQTRYWEPMVNCNLLKVAPGFLIGARQNEKNAYLSQLDTSRKYLAGYHIPLRQTVDTIDDAVHAINVDIPDKVIFFCANSTWGGQTNQGKTMELPSLGTYYAILQVKVIDAKLGCRARGSIQEVDEGVLELRCQDNSVRQFDGYRYGSDLTIDNTTGQDKIKNAFEESQMEDNSCYTDRLGHIFWEKQ
jgi:hypothetical protein